MYSDLLSLIQTTDDLEMLIQEMEELKASLFKGFEAGFEDTLASKVRHRVSSCIRKDLDSNPEVAKSSYLNDLSKLIATLRVIEIEVAFEFTDRAIDRLSSFLRQAGLDKFVLKINFNPDILGGAVIVSRGEYRDLSLRKIFDQEFDKNNDLVLAMLGK